jgi:hypothetical protein
MAKATYISSGKLQGLLRQGVGLALNYVQIDDEGRLTLGTAPMTASHWIDFETETVLPIGSEVSLPRVAEFSEVSTRRSRLGRRSGAYWVEVKSKRIECSSLKEGLATALREIEAIRPGTLEALSLIKPRSKRIVSKERSGLFDQPDLSEKYAEPLVNGWWYGTNNSAQETTAWLMRACQIAKFLWNSDIKVSW